MMRIKSFFVIFFILWAQVAGAQSITTIDVRENGSAHWIVEKHIPLATQAEINEWEGFIKNGTHLYRYKRDVEDFSQKINLSLKSAENYSNRSMEVKQFNITYDTVKTLPDAFGMVRVSFEWDNFSQLEDDRILIGDVFSEGMVLSSDNVLIIDIPEGYESINASPNYDKQDGNRLIWDGTMYRSLGKGEPNIILSPITVKPIDENNGIFTDEILLVIAISIVLVIIIAIYLIRRKSQTPEGENNNDIQTPLPELTEEDLRDEEMVEHILNRFGGQTYQSNIVKESGFSKSKISILLAQMKEEGRIMKIRKGKENLIRLVENK